MRGASTIAPFTSPVRRSDDARAARTICEATYRAHLDSVVRRASRALEAAAIDSLLVHSGAPPDAVPGRPALPLQGQRALQALGAAHGRGGLLRLLRARATPADALSPPARTTGTSRPTCRTATGPRHFELHAIVGPGGGAPAAAGRPEPYGLPGRGSSRAHAVGRGRHQPASPDGAHWISSAPRRRPTSSSACARRAGSGRAGTWPRPRRFRDGRLGIRDRARVPRAPAGSANRSCRTTRSSR